MQLLMEVSEISNLCNMKLDKDALKVIVDKFPPVRKYLLDHLIRFLHILCCDPQDEKMNEEKISLAATIFGPLICRLYFCSPMTFRHFMDLDSHRSTIKTTCLFIEHYEFIFNKTAVTIQQQTSTLDHLIQNLQEEDQELEHQLAVMERIGEKHPEQFEDYEQHAKQLKERQAVLQRNLQLTKERRAVFSNP
jgi:hypothetical protein